MPGNLHATRPLPTGAVPLLRMLQPELKGEAPRDSFDRPTRSRGIGRGFPLRNGSDSASPRSDGSRSSGPEDSYGILGLPFIAMDLEGVHLSREGKLCLVQLCLGDDIYTAYVLDVVSLGPVETFSVATPRGTTLRSALEDPNVCKLCFDPRKDVDALYHQSGVLINGAFDLQLVGSLYFFKFPFRLHDAPRRPKWQFGVHSFSTSST